MDFEVHSANVRGVDIAYLREGAGGFPLVLLHGWPESKRIWARNVGPLAAAGFEVIAPDLRGMGDSGQAADGFYDTASYSRDVEALVRGELGHERIVTCGGDVGGFVAQDLALRFDGLVVRQVLFNTVLPGMFDGVTPVSRMAGDYFIRQATDADGLAAELDTPEKRRRYVAQMYGPRFWASPGAFTPEDVDFHTEPFGDAQVFRASIANYEAGLGRRESSEPPLVQAQHPTPTLVLYGPEDHVIPASFPDLAASVFVERVGPFVVPGAGHFLQWEQPEVLNNALRYFCLDLLGRSVAS
jgi:pimeloyl-ACP methyl ester carboxylesterase